MLDLPGVYDLFGQSEDERRALDAVNTHLDTAVILNVIDANNLVRNLYLTLQLIESGATVVLALNMTDELAKRGLTADTALLSKRLGIPVILASARKKTTAVTVKNAVLNVKRPGLRRLPYLGDGADSSEAARAARRYAYIESVTDGVLKPLPYKKRKPRIFSAAARIFNAAALHSVLWFPLFLCVLAAVFAVTFGFLGSSLSNLVGRFCDVCLYAPIFSALNAVHAPSFLIGLICDGVIKGGAAVFKLLPQIVLMLLCLAVLEDSGYLSRVAFMSDGIFSRAGLSGRSVFTVIMGFGCSSVAVLSARGVDEENARKKTVFLTPFAPCSAKLPVFLTVSSAFFGGYGALIVFALYAVSLSTALLLAIILQKLPKTKSGESAALSELPPYRAPSLYRLWRVVTQNAKAFLSRIGSVVLTINVIVYVLAGFSLSHGFNGGTPVLEQLAGLLSPLFKPLGFGNWRAVAALLSGIVAKEGVLAAFEALGGLDAVFIGAYPALSALSFLVFMLFYTPCIATVAATKRESGRRWAAFSVVITTAIAYLAALLVRLFGLLFYRNTVLFFCLLPLLFGVVIAFVLTFKRKKTPRSCKNCTAGCTKRG